MALTDEDRPKKIVVHEIGQDLGPLSVEELQARVEILKNEIRRIEDDIQRKKADRMAADRFFKQ